MKETNSSSSIFDQTKVVSLIHNNDQNLANSRYLKIKKTILKILESSGAERAKVSKSTIFLINDCYPAQDFYMQQLNRRPKRAF